MYASEPCTQTFSRDPLERHTYRAMDDLLGSYIPQRSRQVGSRLAHVQLHGSVP